MTFRLLLTGANSFIGAALLTRLSEREGIEVVATYRQNRSALLENPPHHISYQVCDLTRADDVSGLLASQTFDAVVHLAAARPDRDELGFGPIAQRDNVEATERLVTEAKNAGCQRFVFVSAIAVYDGLEEGFREDMALSPTSVFGQSKLASEDFLAESCDDFFAGVTLRMPGVHGAGKNRGSVYAFLKGALAGEPLRIAEPNSLFRLLFIDDATEALLLALKTALPDPYCCYNVAGEEILSLVDLADRVIATTGSDSKLLVDDNFTCRKQILEIAKIEQQLGFKPTPLEVHLATYCDSLKG
jgi:nucleoside-diphosphate-sugar epimerase